MAPNTDSSLQPEDQGEHQGFDEKWESKGRRGGGVEAEGEFQFIVQVKINCVIANCLISKEYII